MPLGDKYRPLANWLRSSGRVSVTLTFDELCSILGFLPPVAYRDNAFWANDRTQSSSYGWFDAGYRTARVRRGEKCVTFIKDEEYVQRILHGITPERVANPEKVQLLMHRRGKIRDDVPFPCQAEVDKYLLAWEKLEGYALQEKALYKLFHHTYPKNTDISEVLIKVSVLNDFYGTNIFRIVPVAQLIVSLDIDSRLDDGNIGLVGDIGYTELDNGAPHRYSFATKYCSHHNAQAFPIYDSYVDKVLKYFNSIHSFSDFSRDELKDYAVFKSALQSFRQYYGLEKYSLKQIDQYIWQLGKEKFPNKY